MMISQASSNINEVIRVVLKSFYKEFLYAQKKHKKQTSDFRLDVFYTHKKQRTNFHLDVFYTHKKV